MGMSAHKRQNDSSNFDVAYVSQMLEFFLKQSRPRIMSCLDSLVQMCIQMNTCGNMNTTNIHRILYY